MESGLIVYYPFDGNTSDESGNGNDGVPNCSTCYETNGFFDEAFHFDGSQRIDMPAENIGLTNEQGTVAFWVLLPDSSASDINCIWWAGKYGGDMFGSQNEMHVHTEGGPGDSWTGGEVSFVVVDSLSLIQTPSEYFIFSDPWKGKYPGNTPSTNSITITDNAWHHIACTWEYGGVMAMYIDGQAVWDTTAYNPNIWQCNLMTIGVPYSKDYRQLNGYLDEFRLYDIALDKDAISELYNKDMMVSNNVLKANFSVSPLVGSTDTVSRFDASLCTDTEDDLADLQVRWDFDSNGTFETNWSTTKTATYQYSSTGTKNITLEVMDLDGNIDDTTISITVAYPIKMNVAFKNVYNGNYIAGKLNAVIGEQLFKTYSVTESSATTAETIFPGRYTFVALSEGRSAIIRDVNIPETATNISFRFNLGYIGDYDFDQDIDFDDLTRFTLAWQRSLDSIEIGPVTGDLPNTWVEPDNTTDFEDLMVFAQMWEIENYDASTIDSIIGKSAGSTQFLIEITDETATEITYCIKPHANINYTATRFQIQYQPDDISFSKYTKAVNGFAVKKLDEKSGLLEICHANLNNEVVQSNESIVEITFNKLNNTILPISGLYETVVQNKHTTSLLNHQNTDEPEQLEIRQLNNELLIQVPGSIENGIRFRLYNLTGRMLATEENIFLEDENTFELPINNLNKGIYIIQIQTNIGAYTSKFVIE